MLAQVIYSEENISQLLDVTFVSEWDNSDSYSDIVRGLGCLLNQIFKTNRLATNECLKRTVRPILRCLNESV